MFAPDIVHFREFYATPFGSEMRALLQKTIRQFWPELGSDSLLAIGFPTPYLELYAESNANVYVCMPAQQGAVYWPPMQGNIVFMAHESELPIPDNSINRVLLIHSLENSEQLSWLLDDVWRVLTPGGRAMVVAPNRLSFWSRSAKSPFGYGRPFSMPQLRDLLTERQFTLTRYTSALFVPPTHMNWCWRIAPYIECLGKLFCRVLGGVLVMEAEKQIYAAIKQPVAARQRYRVSLPAAEPVMRRHRAG